MTIELKVKSIDIINIIITKGANFTSTFFIFSLMSAKLNSESFANFGYWWSIGVMLGGVFLGGVSAALIREVSEYKSLSNVKKIIFKVMLVLVFLVISLFVFMRNVDTNSSYFLLFIAFLFGIALQLQISILSLLRAIEASRANLIASFILAVSVPFSFYLIVQEGMSLGSLMISVVIAYSICLVIILFSTKKILAKLFQYKSVNISNNIKFYSNIGSFGLLTIYVSIVLIVDASIFKYFANPADFNMVVTSKIYFERFVLPLLLIFSAALSIIVLRYDGSHPATLEVDLSFKKAIKFVLLTISIVLGYYLYIYIYSKYSISLSLPIVVFVTIGYILYVLNGVLLDVLVIRKGTSKVFYYISFFLIIYIVGQFVIISEFGVIGWAIFLFTFHLFVSMVLIFSGCGTTKKHNFT